MQPHTKKVVVMMAVTISIIALSYLLPAVIIPMTRNMSQAGACMDYGCAQQIFTRCGSYQGPAAGEGSTTFIDSMTKGMQGMLCMMGIGNSNNNSNDAVRASAFAGPLGYITFN